MWHDIFIQHIKCSQHSWMLDIFVMISFFLNNISIFVFMLNMFMNIFCDCFIWEKMKQ